MIHYFGETFAFRSLDRVLPDTDPSLRTNPRLANGDELGLAANMAIHWDGIQSERIFTRSPTIDTEIAQEVRKDIEVGKVTQRSDNIPTRFKWRRRMIVAMGCAGHI